MGAGPEEPDAIASEVETGTQAVSAFGRCHYVRRGIEIDFREAMERVRDTRELQRRLTFVPNVRVREAAAGRVAGRHSAVVARTQDVDDIRPESVLRFARDADADAFTGDRTGHEHNAAVQPREHPPTRNGPLDKEGDGSFFHSLQPTGDRARTRALSLTGCKLWKKLPSPYCGSP